MIDRKPIGTSLVPCRRIVGSSQSVIADYRGPSANFRASVSSLVVGVASRGRRAGRAEGGRDLVILSPSPLFFFLSLLCDVEQVSTRPRLPRDPPRVVRTTRPGWSGRGERATPSYREREKWRVACRSTRPPRARRFFSCW